MLNFAPSFKTKIMTQKAMKITGWVLTIVLAFMFSMSAFMKLSQNPTAMGQAAAFGINASTYVFIGIIEIISLILFIIPRTGILGTLLLVAYLGGAIVTHLEHKEPVTMAVAIQVVLWITAFLRFPELKQRLMPLKN